jgi:hypothetical protein
MYVGGMTLFLFCGGQPHGVRRQHRLRFRLRSNEGNDLRGITNECLLEHAPWAGAEGDARGR